MRKFFKPTKIASFHITAIYYSKYCRTIRHYLIHVGAKITLNNSRVSRINKKLSKFYFVLKAECRT